MTPDLHSLPVGSRPEIAVRNNGPDNLVLERYKLRELAEGWPCYRDACEWENFESMFHSDCYVYTTWTGRIHYKDFIAGSKAGMDAGAFIMHRIHGSTTDINPTATRAVTKMKASITQRFVLNDSIEADAESDCRFFFFWERDARTQNWGARFVRHIYEKDKLIPVNPNRVPALDEEKLKKYPSGYRYLAYCQETTMGIKVKMDLPLHRREGGKEHDELYWKCKKWIDGETIEV